MLDDWHLAAASADFARYFGHLADDAVFLGTDATERWTKAAFETYARPHFAKGKAWTFRATRRAVRFAGSGYAWFDEDLETLGLGPARGSGVLALRDGRWRIVQYNLALTVPNERFALVREAAGASAVLEATSTDPVARLAWLGGSWVTRVDDEVIEESWLPPSGAAMVGSSRTVKVGATGPARGGEEAFFEHLLVRVRDGRLVYVAQPRGAAATEFAEVPTNEATAVVFENAAHDWPKRITYRKADGRLRVTVEGAPGQRVVTYTLTPALIARRTKPTTD